VWAKVVVADALAKRMGGRAVLLSVDTDAPKHLHLRYPGESRPITDHEMTAAWSGLVRTPSPMYVERLRRDLAEDSTAWGYAPPAIAFLASMRTLAMESGPLPNALTNAMHEIDWGLGLRHDALLTSPLWDSEGWLTLVAHVLCRAGDFAAAYNSALAEYRRAHGLRTVGRPWPDLARADAACELPLWLDDLGMGRRERAFAILRDGRWGVERDGSRLEIEPSEDGRESARRLGPFLRAARLRLTPRALMLTVFVRLCLADHFIHGIGGARYDQATDLLIGSWMGLVPPVYSVATATLYFPANSGPRVNLAALRQEGRRLRHGGFSPRKRELLAEIDAAPRLSAQRRERFFAMHREIEAGLAGGALADWQRRWEEAVSLHRSQEGQFDRELFYAIQPTHRLEGLMAAFAGMVGKG